MQRLRTSFVIVTSIFTLGVALGAATKAYADCAPQTEILYPVQYTDGAGFHDRLIHLSPNPNCPIDYYSTEKEDQYVVGFLMPTIHVSEDRRGGYDLIHLNNPNPINLDISDIPEIAEISIGSDQPYETYIRANDGYNDLNCKSQLHEMGAWSASDATVTWHALGGDDRIEGGARCADISYGGLGNDWYSIWNAEDRAIELPDEGFDVATIGPDVRNYRFDPNTSIEAIYLEPGATVDLEFLPENVIFLKFSVDNRGPYSTHNIVDVLPDIMSGTPENDYLNGGFGDSTIVSGSGTDVVNGGTGNDKIDGGTGNDALIGGPGNDNVQGGEGSDLIVGGSGEGNDTYNGGPGADTVKYTSAKDGIIVNLSAKANQATSAAPGDAAGIGIDQIALVENVIAGNFNDQVIGSKLANTLDGEDGNDLLRGEGGNDILIGGRGSDTLIGGAGNEVFVYRAIEDSTPSESDTITDFSVGKEKIDLSAIDASTVLDGNNTFMFNGAAPIGTSSQGEISVVKVDNPGTTNDYMMIYIDTDADPDPEAAIRVNKLLKLSVKNFVL